MATNGTYISSYDFHTTSLDVKDGETTFDALFIYTSLEAVGTYSKDSTEWTKAGFRHGEAQLQAMSKQLKTLPLYDDESHTYLADGIIKLYEMNSIELLLLETSGPFANTEKPKIAFGHHKGLFGALAMLKTVADMFPQADIDTFKRIKIFFIPGTGKT